MTNRTHTLVFASLLCASAVLGCGRSEFTVGGGESLDEGADTDSTSTNQNDDGETGGMSEEESPMPDLPERSQTNGIPEGSEGALVMPLCRDESLGVIEGWFYSVQEETVHGQVEHRAIDIAAEYGAPVFAAAEGWALATYETHPIVNQGKKIGMGGGLMVVVWHPELELFTGYRHLSGIAGGMPYYNPEFKMTWEGFPSWSPAPVMQQSGQFMSMATKHVGAGELIGYVGVTGLAAEGEEIPSPTPAMVDSWKGPHLELQVHGDRDGKGQTDPGTIYDPFNLYRDYSAYDDALDVCQGMMGCQNETPSPRQPAACGG